MPELLINALALILLQSTGASLSNFTTDGCSSFPNGTMKAPSLWLQCCTEHDFDYWKGGSFQERLESDQRLQLCVAGKGEAAVAALMLAGVRVGGSPLVPTPFRWGYGWPYPRMYGPLSCEEHKLVRKLIPSIVREHHLTHVSADQNVRQDCAD